jgi:hypothetical protein
VPDRDLPAHDSRGPRPPPYAPPSAGQCRPLSPGEQDRRRSTLGLARACSKGQQRPPPSSLTNEDRHYSDRSPPPQRGVAAFPLPRLTCTTHHIQQHLVPRSLAGESMPGYFPLTAIDGHRSSWSSNISAEPTFPRL